MTVTRPQLIVSMIPEELRALPQWVNYSLEWNEARGKYDKRPYNARTGQLASTTDRSTWSTFEVVLANYKSEHFPGVGFVFTPDDPYAGVDLDGCFDPVTETVEGWAEEAIQRFESYTEVTPSETGVHIVVRGALPPGGGHNKHPYEAYDQGRFFTFTGQVLDGRDVIHERSNELEDFCREHFPAGTTYHVETDLDLVERAKAAINGDKFARVWSGDDSDYAGDASAADLGLANHLLFYTEGDTLRSDMLFRQSDRMRRKWDEKHYGDGTTYGQHTIGLAFATWRQEHGTAQENLEVSTQAPPPALHGVLPFPFHALPEVVQAFANEWATLLHSIPEIVAIPMLATASAAIGNSRSVRVNARYFESSCLWMATISPPGSAKSAASTQAKLPLTSEESRLRTLWRKDKEDVAFRNRRKGRNEALEDVPKEPRYFTKNVTLEKLIMIHSENQRGLGVFNDELGSFIGSFDQYRSKGQGADRQNWLSIWDGDEITVDRIREGGSFHVERALVSVFGTIQPDLLKTLTGEVGNDGFLARFLFTYIPRLPLAGADDPNPDDAVVDWWTRTVKEMLAWQTPTITPYTPHGGKTFRDLSWQWAKEGDSPETDPRLLDFYAKGVRHAARLALVLHCIREASGEIEEPLIDEVTAAGAWALMRYFASTMRYVVMKVEEGETGRMVDQIVEFAKKRGGKITLRDAQRARVAGIRGAEEMGKAFRQVQNYGFGKVSTEAVGGVQRLWLALNEE